MLGVLAIYVVAMLFAVKKDRSEREAEASLQSVSVTVNSDVSGDVSSPKPDSPAIDNDSKPAKDDNGCCNCCCGCEEDEKKIQKSKTDKYEAEDEEKGCCGCLHLFLCNNPLSRADKITILLCMIFLNIVLSAGLNEKGIAPSKAQQYVIGVISGSVGMPVKTVITMMFGKIPKKYYLAPYLASYALCILSFVVTLVYTIEFQQYKANKWLVSTGISTLEDIVFIAGGFAIIYFCPGCNCAAKKMI